MSSPTSGFTAALVQIDAVERSYNDGLDLIIKLRIGLWKANEDQFTGQINHLDSLALHRPIDHANLALRMIDLSLNHDQTAEDKFIAALPSLYVADEYTFSDPHLQEAVEQLKTVNGVRPCHRWVAHYGFHIADGDMEVKLDFTYRAISTIFERGFRSNGSVLLLLELYSELPSLETCLKSANRLANQILRLYLTQALISFGIYLTNRPETDIRAQIPVLRNE